MFMNEAPNPAASRRPYQKPMILVESLTMASTIAASCADPVGNHADQSTCGINVNDGFATVEIFLDQNICDRVESWEVAEIYCYNNPEGTATTFGS